LNWQRILWFWICKKFPSPILKRGCVKIGTGLTSRFSEGGLSI
jgi:hypothetical protein